MIISTLLSTWRSLRPSLGLIRPIELSLSSPCLCLSCPLLHPRPQGWTPALLLSHKPNCLPAPPSLSSPRLSALLFISCRSDATFLRFHLPLASTSRPHIQTRPVVLLIFQPFFFPFTQLRSLSLVFYTSTPSKHSFIKFPRRAVNKRWCVYVILVQLFKTGLLVKKAWGSWIM